MKVAELFEKHGFQDVAITVKTRHSLDCLVGRTLALWPFKKPSAGEGSCALPCQRCGSVLKIDIGVSGDCGTLPVILSHPAHNHDDKSGRSAEDSLFRGAVGELAGLGDAKPSLAVAHLHDRPLPAHVQQIENPGLRLSLLKKHGLLGLGPAASVVCLYANLDEEEGYLARLLTGSGSAGSVDTSRGTDGSSGDRLQAAVTASTTDVTALLAAGTPLAVFGYSAANKGMSWNKRPAKLLTVLFQETEAEYIKKAERHFMYMQLVKDWDRAPANTAPDAVKAVQAEAAEFIWDALTRKVGPLLDPRDEVVSEIGRQVCMAETTCVTLRLQGQGGPLTVILWLHCPKEGADGACFVLPGIGVWFLPVGFTIIVLAAGRQLLQGAAPVEVPRSTGLEGTHQPEGAPGPASPDVASQLSASPARPPLPLEAPTVPRPDVEARRETSSLDPDSELPTELGPSPVEPAELGPGPLGPTPGPLLPPDQPPVAIKTEPGTAPGEARFAQVWSLPYDAAELAALRRRYLEPRVVTVEISSATRSGAVRNSTKQRKCRPAAEQSYERLWPHLQSLSEEVDEEAAAAAAGAGGVTAAAPSALAPALLAALRILRAYEAACGLDAAPRDAALSRVLPAYGAEVTAARNAAAEVTSAEVLDLTAEEIDVEAYVLQQWPAEVVARVAVKREAV